MSFKSLVIAGVIVQIVKSAERQGKVSEVADQIDKVIDDKFGKQSEGIQQSIVENVLLPLGRRLMREKPDEFRKILVQEAEA